MSGELRERRDFVIAQAFPNLTTTPPKDSTSFTAASAVPSALSKIPVTSRNKIPGLGKSGNYFKTSSLLFE